jgi:crotonobetainyl-CoA:carnitine CoA-transferase CaiB-like acyl-CoA transferase
MISGPLATMMLGDQGADVIKVEPPGTGDLLRYFGTARGGLAAFFATSNRNKRSVVFDLKQAKGIELIKALAADADVFVQNFRPGAVERMGIGEAAIRAVNENIVYVSISGFGERGPYSQQRVYDPIIQALSGMASVQTDPDTGKPSMVRTILPDKLTSVVAAQAISSALFARERTGKGQHVRLAMLDALVSWLWPDGMMNHTYLGEGVSLTPPISNLNLVFEAADGFITAGAVSDAEWAGLCNVMGRPELATNPRFDSVTNRTANLDELVGLADDLLKARSCADLLAHLEREDVPCAPILTRDQLLEDPQVATNELILETHNPHAGRLREPRPAARFDATPAGIERHAPALGEHTEEVLRELGVTDVDTLRGAGVIN